MKKQITNVRAVLPDKILTSATVAFEDGKITYVGNEIQPGYEIIDGENNYLLAGFVEIHCHGGNNLEFMDASPEEIKELAKYHLKNGTTTLYATTMTDTWEAIESALCNYAEVEKSGELYNLAGIHLEGPWLSPAQCGAQSIERMDLPTVERLDYIAKKYPFVKRFTIAPELPGGMEVGKNCEGKIRTCYFRWSYRC